MSAIIFLVIVATVGEVLHLNLKHIRSYVPKLKNKKKESNEDIVRSEINISVEQVPNSDKKSDTDSSQSSENNKSSKKKTFKESKSRLVFA